MQEKEKDKIFDTETRLYKYYLNQTENDPDAIQFIKSLFKIELIDLDKTPDQSLVAILEVVGFDKFFELVTLFGGKVVRFPKVDKIKRFLVLAIAYYQVVILGLTPREAGKRLMEKLECFNLKQKSLKSLLSRLQQTMDSLAEKAVQKKMQDEVDQ